MLTISWYTINKELQVITS